MEPVFREFTNDDLPEVGELYATVYHRENPSAVSARIARARMFGVVAVAAERIVGFHLRRRIAPDVAGDGDLCVAEGWRGRGIGAALTGRLDVMCATAGLVMSVVLNSTLYETVPPKRSAEGYYRRLGYRRVATTGPTVLMVKHHVCVPAAARQDDGVSMNVQMDFEEAKRLASAAHAGQVDKAGAPYIGHPLRVARLVAASGRPDLAAVAVLHDVVEDTEVSLGELALSARQSSTLDALTRRAGETYSVYIDRLRQDPDAVVVKIADLRDNLDPVRRLDGLESLYARYRRTLAKLLGDTAGP